MSLPQAVVLLSKLVLLCLVGFALPRGTLFRRHKGPRKTHGRCRTPIKADLTQGLRV